MDHLNSGFACIVDLAVHTPTDIDDKVYCRHSLLSCFVLLHLNLRRNFKATICRTGDEYIICKKVMFATKLANPDKKIFLYQRGLDKHPSYLIIRFRKFNFVLRSSNFSCFLVNSSWTLLASVNFLFHSFFLTSQLIIKFHLKLVYVYHFFCFFFRFFTLGTPFLESLSVGSSCCLSGQTLSRTFCSCRATGCLFCSGH